MMHCCDFHWQRMIVPSFLKKWKLLQRADLNDNALSKLAISLRVAVSTELVILHADCRGISLQVTDNPAGGNSDRGIHHKGDVLSGFKYMAATNGTAIDNTGIKYEPSQMAWNQFVLPRVACPDHTRCMSADKHYSWGDQPGCPMRRR